MALNVAQYEDIVSHLGKVPGLVDMLEERRTGFPDAVLEWLRAVEKSLENNHMAVVSQVSGCRAMLIESARGVYSEEISFTGRPTVRKIQDGVASLVLQRVSDLLHAAIAEREAAFAEAERISRQVIAIADAKGMVQACDDGRPHQAVLECLRGKLGADQDLASVYVHLVSAVGKTDVLVFLDRAIFGLG
jgi:hypothetical protein